MIARRLTALGALSVLAMSCGPQAPSNSDPSPSTGPTLPPSSNSAGAASRVLAPRTSSSFRKQTLDASMLRGAYPNRVEIKFREGSAFLARGGKLTVDATAPSSLVAAPADAINRIDAVASRARRHAFVPVHSLDAPTLRAMKARGEARTGEELPDLSLWTALYVDVASEAELADIINDLNQLDEVELAEPARMTLPASLPREGSTLMPERVALPWPDLDAPTTSRLSALEALPPGAAPGDEARVAPVEPAFTTNTHQDCETNQLGNVTTCRSAANAAAPSFVSQQLHRTAAPTGVDTNYLRATYYSATGGNWAYSDVEYGWNQNHVDLTRLLDPGVLILGSFSHSNPSWVDHGTASIGISSASDNSFGTVGVVPDAQVRVAQASSSSLAAPIAAVAAQFWNGATILLEQQAVATFHCGTADFVPVEDAQVNFDAIKTATANGRIVVEPAGNGNCNLDDSRFGGRYDGSAARDSGAIIVGAGERDTRQRVDSSTFGSRVDTHAEGDGKVVTTGYGDLFNANGNNDTYTGAFGGTSGASAILAATVTSMSSILWNRFGSFYNPRELRDVFRRDGTPQVFGRSGRVGNRPDMRRNISHMVSRHAVIRSTDFDGDGRKDIAVWRPDNGFWYIHYSSTGATDAIQWGAHDDIPVPADVEGDSRAELIVWRPSNGTFYVRRWNGTSYPVPWGGLGDIPFALDFDGDGKAQLGVMRLAGLGKTTENHWYILSQNNTTSPGADVSVGSTDWTLGADHDIPLVGDFDGDHRDDIIVFRGATGTWLVKFAQGGTQQFPFGAWGDVPLVYHTAGRDYAAFWRPGNGEFWVNHPFAANPFPWGGPGDIPRMADTDGDGSDELIVYRPSQGNWYTRNGDTVPGWGAPLDIPVAR